MVKTLNLLTKGILQITYENTFLKKEVTLFRKTNHILSKRRKTKNKRFQKEGTLTVQKGQNLLAEKKGNSKQLQLTVAKGNRCKRVKTKSRRYNVCGKREHNARTC